MKAFSFDKLKKTAAGVLAAVIIFAVLSPLAPRARALDDPAVDAEAAILVDIDAGSVLYSLNESVRRAPASLVKIMTALLAVESYERGDVKLSDRVTVTDADFSDIDSDGSTEYKRDETVTFEDLLYASFVSSANEPCNAIARTVSGDVPTFISMMNTRAAELGCKDTSFGNTHGMPSDLNYSTAYDLYLITREALTHNLFKRVCSAKTWTVDATNVSDARVLRTGNNLLNDRSGYYYEYASGVKTGYTDAAGYCLIATASKDGRNLLSVILGAKSVIAEDGRTEVKSYTETKRLMNWGFDNFNLRELLTTMKLMAEIPVRLGRGANSVVLRPEENVTALLPNDADLTQVKLEPVLYEEGTLTAPVEKGAVLGEVKVSFNGVDYGTVKLIANTAVELDRTAYIGSEIRETLRNKYVRLTITVLVLLVILYVAFIIYYNVHRANKRKTAAELARRRVQEYRRSQEPAGASRRQTYADYPLPREDRDSRAPAETRAPQRPTQPTTGKSFEEIEELLRRQNEELNNRTRGDR